MISDFLPKTPDHTEYTQAKFKISKIMRFRSSLIRNNHLELFWRLVSDILPRVSLTT